MTSTMAPSANSAEKADPTATLSISMSAAKVNRFGKYMLPSEDMSSQLLNEILNQNDWISVAEALTLFGSSSWDANRDDVKQILDCVNSSGILRLGHVTTTYEEIQKPIPVTDLLNRIFGASNDSDRSAFMMELFIADIPEQPNE